MAPTPDPFATASADTTTDTASSTTTDTTKKVEGGDPADTATGGVGQGEGSEEAEGEVFATARPDNVPEKFWDKEKGAIRTDDVLKSYGELEKALAKAKEPPKAPEKYEYKVPEKLTKDFGLKEVKSDDPYVVGFSEFAKKKGYSQEQYQEFIDFYLDMELSQANKTMVSEFGKLGDQQTAVKRVKALNTFAKTKLSPESAAIMSEMAKSASAIKLFEEMMGLSTKQRNTVDEDTQVGEELSEEEVGALMLQEAYNDPKHPEYNSLRAKVTKEFERLYPDKKR